MGRKWGECAPFGEEELGPHLAQCGLGQLEAYLYTKFYLDPFNRFATIHQRYIQTDRQDK